MLKNWLCCPFSSWNMSSVDFLLHLLMVALLSLCFLTSSMLSCKKAGEGGVGGSWSSQWLLHGYGGC